MLCLWKVRSLERPSRCTVSASDNKISSKISFNLSDNSSGGDSTGKSLYVGSDSESAKKMGITFFLGASACKNIIFCQNCVNLATV